MEHGREPPQMGWYVDSTVVCTRPNSNLRVQAQEMCMRAQQWPSKPAVPTRKTDTRSVSRRMHDCESVMCSSARRLLKQDQGVSHE